MLWFLFLLTILEGIELMVKGMFHTNYNITQHMVYILTDFILAISYGIANILNKN